MVGLCLHVLDPVFYHYNDRVNAEIIAYEDRQYTEIANILDSLLETYGQLAHILFNELGAGAAGIIQRACRTIKSHLKDIFEQVPLENPDRLERAMILANISRHHPDAAQRFLFVDAFCELFACLLKEIDFYLGAELHRAAAAGITAEVRAINRYARRTALRSHLLETFVNLGH